MFKTVDKSHYQTIQTLIEQNDSITGFDLYYLGFFSHFVSQITLDDIFTHIGNIISLYNDHLITSQEKIEFLIRMLSKKIDSKMIDSLNPQTGDIPDKSNNFLHSYFSQILKLIPKFPNVSKFELFYIGRFHAICPSYKISELFQHINNINTLVTEDLIDEETKVDFLLTILNKKIQTSFSGETVLNIPQGDLSPISARPSSPKPSFSSQDRPVVAQPSLVQQIASRKEASSQSSNEEDKKGSSLKWDRQDTVPVKSPVRSGNHSDVDEENNNRRNLKNQTTVRRQFTFQSSNKKGDQVEEEEGEEEQEEEREDHEEQEEHQEEKDYESEEDAFSLLKKQNETKKKASVEKEVVVQSMEEEEEDNEGHDEDNDEDEDEEKATEGLSALSAVEEESGKKRAMSEHLSETNKRRGMYSRGGTIEEESEGREMTFGENSQSQMIGSQKAFGGTIEDESQQHENIHRLGATPPDTIENQNERFEEEHEELEKGARRVDSGVSAGSKKSQVDNDLEVQKLMAQLYPGSEQNNKKQPGGTLDDIMNSLLGGSDEGKVSEVTSLNNSLMPSLDTRHFSVPKDKIQAGQEMAQSLEQHQGGNSLEEHHEEEDEDEGFVAPKSHKKDDMEVEKEGVSQTMESEERFHDDRGTLADPSEIGSSLPISPSLGPDSSSYILNMKNKQAENPYKELLLKQIATNAQPGVYLDSIVKQEEEPRNSIREAQTQADPTLEDHEGDHHIMVIRSPGGLDAHNIRTCETEKQTLSQVPKESLQIEEDHEEDEAVEEIASNKPSQQDDRQSSWSQSRRETFNEMYPAVGATQLSKMSSFPVNLNTLEEVNLSKQMLEELQREREAAEKKKVLMAAEVSKKISQEVQPVEEEKKKDDNKDAMEEEKEVIPVIPEVVEKPIDIEEEKRKAVEEAEEKKLLAERELRIQKEKEQELQRTAEKELLEDLSRCPLCAKALVLKKVVAMEGCGHEIHEDCLKEYIEKKVEGKEVVIICPRKRCETDLRLVDFMDYLDAEKQEKYVTVVLNSYIESMEDVNCCPTPGCHYAFLKSYKPNKFACSQCEKSYCMNCRVEWHQGLNCEEYQRQHKVEDDAWHKDRSGFAIGKYKQCGNCKHWACKKFGSKLVECQCKQKFCYVCGRKKLRGECNCPQQKEDDLRPVVQPELFHKIMNSPAEYRRYTADNKGGKSPVKGGQQGNNYYRANVDDEIELHITALLSQQNSSTPPQNNPLLSSNTNPPHPTSNDPIATLLSTLNNAQKATFTIGGKTISLNLLSEDSQPQSHLQVPQINLFGIPGDDQSSERNDLISTDHPKPQLISHKSQPLPQSTANQTPFSSQNPKTMTMFDSERKESYFSEKPESLLQPGGKVPGKWGESEISGSSFAPEKDSMSYQKSNANSSLVASLIDQSYLEPIDLTTLPSLGFKSHKENMSFGLPNTDQKNKLLSPIPNIKSLPPPSTSMNEPGKKDELVSLSSDEEKEKIDVKKELSELNGVIEGLVVPEDVSNKFKKLVTYLEKENQRLERRRKRIEDQSKAQLLREIITPKLSLTIEPPSPSHYNEVQLHFAFMFAAPLVLCYEDLQNNKKLSPIYVEVDYRTELETVKKTLSKSVDPIKFRSFVANQTGLSECFNMKPRALHFCGHGVKNSNENFRSVKSGKGEGDFLIMEDEEGSAEFKSCSHLQYLLQTNQMNDKLEFVFVASCHSSLVGEVFRKAGAKHVICVGREEKILDDACLKFTEHFYQSYFTGRNSVCKAFSDAKEYLKQMSHLPSGEENKFILLKQEGIHRCEPMFGLKDYNPKEKEEYMKVILKDLTPVPLFHKIPAKIESFLGRHIEQHEVIKRIKTHRFVTIKGISGIGKSSLCREVANYLYERNTFQDGIIYVDATGCDSVERIISVINSKLGYITKSNEGKPVGGIMVQVANYLSDRVKDALIILDNVDEVYHNERAKFRKLIELILVTCFKIKVLITSRSAIGGSFQEASEKVFNLSYLDEINARELFFSKAPRPIDVDEMKEFLQYDPSLNSEELLLPSENRLRKGSSSSGHYLEAELCIQKTGLDELTLFSKHHLMKMLGGHPQAISLAAALLVDRKLQDLYDKMISDPIMNVLRAEGLSENEANALNSMEVSLDITLKHLEEKSNEAINFFGLLGLLPGGVRESDLKTLWGTSWMDCTALLLKYSLIIRQSNSDSNDVTRYNLYPFMVKYAEERIQEEEKFTISNKIVHYLKDKAETIYNKIGSTFVDSHFYFDIFLNEETNFKVCLKRELELARNRPESPKKYSEKWDQDLESDMFGSTEASLKLLAKYEAGKEEIRKSMQKPLTRAKEQEKQATPEDKEVVVTEKFAHELGPSKLRSSLHIQRRSTISDKIMERYNSFKTSAEKGRFTISSTMNLKGDMMKNDYDLLIPLDHSLVLGHIPVNSSQFKENFLEKNEEPTSQEIIPEQRNYQDFGNMQIDLATSVQIKKSDIQGPRDDMTPNAQQQAAPQPFKTWNFHDLKHSSSINIYTDPLKSPSPPLKQEEFTQPETNFDSLQSLDILIKGPMALLHKDILKEMEDEVSTNDVYDELVKELSTKDSMKEVKLLQQGIEEETFNQQQIQLEPFDNILTKSLSILKTSILEDLDLEDCYEEIRAELGNTTAVKTLQKSLFDLDFVTPTKESHPNSALSFESSEDNPNVTSMDELLLHNKSHSSRKSLSKTNKYSKRNSQEFLTSKQMAAKKAKNQKKRHSNKWVGTKGNNSKEIVYPMSQGVLEKARQRSTIHNKQQTTNDPIIEEDENEFGKKKNLTLSTDYGFMRGGRGGNQVKAPEEGKGAMNIASHFAVLYCSILFLLLRFDECGKVIVQGLKLTTQIESRDKVGEANLHKLNGCLNWIKTNYEDSLKDFIQAYDLFEESACILGQAICEAAIGYLSFLLFEDTSTTNQAVKRLEQSLALYKQLGHIFGIYYIHRWLSIIMNKVPAMKGKSKEHAKEARKILSLPKAKREVSGHVHKGGFFVPREMGDHFSIFLEIANICDMKALRKKEEKTGGFTGFKLHSLGSSGFKTNPSRFSSLWTETVLASNTEVLSLKDVGKLETLKEEDEFNAGVLSKSPSNIEQEKIRVKGEVKKNVHPSSLMPSLKKKHSNRSQEVNVGSAKEK